MNYFLIFILLKSWFIARFWKKKDNVRIINSNLMEIPFVYQNFEYKIYIPFNEEKLADGSRLYLQNLEDKSIIDATTHSSLIIPNCYPGYTVHDNYPIQRKKIKRPAKKEM